MSYEISPEMFNGYSMDLSDMIDEAEGSLDTNMISYIRDIWNGEGWKSIVSKYHTEGSTWFCWWQDGVMKHIENDHLTFTDRCDK